jgi:hypothetical protein
MNLDPPRRQPCSTGMVVGCVLARRLPQDLATEQLMLGGILLSKDPMPTCWNRCGHITNQSYNNRLDLCI